MFLFLACPTAIYDETEALSGRERGTPVCRIWLYPQQVRLARFTSTQQQSCLRQHYTLISKVHLPISIQSSHFLHQPASFLSYLASLSSFDLQAQNLMPFSKQMTILSPQHMTIPANTVCHSQLIYGVAQTQYEHQICRFFSILCCTPHITLITDLSVLRKIPISLSYRCHASLPFCIAGLT